MSLQTEAPTPLEELPLAVTANPPGDALVETLTAALDKVADAATADDPVEMVHDARKALKEYRALLRLVPGDAAKTARHAAAATARTLSAARDRQAAREALEALEDADLIPAPHAAQAMAVIDALPHAAAEDADHRAVLLAFLATARADHADHLDTAARAADVVAGLRKAYAKAYAAKDWSRPESLHDLRKRVVTHRYQMAFAADISRGGKGGKRARSAQRLRDILGLYQDLEALKLILAAALGTAHEAVMSDIAAATRTFQRKLVKQAQARHAQLFRHRPRQFEDRLRRRFAPPSL
ncbi:CHAD domain-containing protein [Azorhizobium sp. AG788]|uniref:CHAD domain-containing protein n=1 Tax=Azorhizobium sp. AG788 TaxID=2183897 RepID=UPI0031388FDD